MPPHSTFLPRITVQAESFKFTAVYQDDADAERYWRMNTRGFHLHVIVSCCFGRRPSSAPVG